MRGVPWWGVISSAAAPVLLIGGWTVAAGLQPRFDPVADTISALAAIGATDRWVMTLTFLLGFGSVPHFVFASLGFAGLTLWPAGAAKRGPAVPWGLRPAVAAAAVALLFALLAWFGAELILGAGQVGLAERVVGAAQAAWPLAVVLSCCLPVRAAVPARGANQTSTV